MDKNQITLVLASNNAHKIKELETLLTLTASKEKTVKILTLSDVGFSDEIVEDGESFEENALIKARAAASLGYIGIGDDSGLCVEALGGAPGIYSARYAGIPSDDRKNNEKLLKELEGKENRNAIFVCVIACVFPDGRQSLIARGEAAGRILTGCRGENGFGYDPLFYSIEAGAPFAELSSEQKNAVSHRGKAARDFARRFWRIYD